MSGLGSWLVIEYESIEDLRLTAGGLSAAGERAGEPLGIERRQDSRTELLRLVLLDWLAGDGSEVVRRFRSGDEERDMLKRDSSEKDLRAESSGESALPLASASTSSALSPLKLFRPLTLKLIDLLRRGVGNFSSSTLLRSASRFWLSIFLSIRPTR
mmetsp:Transcript_5272/g.11453  ORF Transcript_5272/g.11453 Transcript_5272/m.11453 type:complete len:157 (+) Transcript_5272:408-878(+)|eukprot:6186662-Pleurochrysis_carterae.AAC.4